jgi:transcriptional regulator with XRE-family HTH domain
MARTREPNFLRAWREFRGMTQAKLAEAVDTTGAVISLLEAGERGLSDKWLRRLAPVLGTTPGNLLDMDPHDVDHDFFEIFNSMSKEMQEQAKSVLKALKGDTPAPPRAVAPPVLPRTSRRAAEAAKAAAEAEAAAPSKDAERPKTRRGGKAPKGV